MFAPDRGIKLHEGKETKTKENVGEVQAELGCLYSVAQGGVDDRKGYRRAKGQHCHHNLQPRLGPEAGNKPQVTYNN